MQRKNLSPAALFDAAVRPGGEQAVTNAGFDIVAGPGMEPPPDAAPGLIAIRRGLGEGRLAVVAAVERVAPSRVVLEAEGIPCEGYSDGVFIEVDAGAAGRRGLRIAGSDGVLSPDVVLLRERPAARLPRAGRRPSTPRWQETENETESADPAPLAVLLAAVYALRRQRKPTVREGYLRSLLEPRSGASPLRDQLQRAVADLEQRQAAIATGQDRAAAVAGLVDQLAAGLLAAAERAFILDTRRSTLELLEPTARDRYLGFEWEAGDFPGGPPGSNEARADQMFAALTRLRPERRANQGEAAAVRADEFDAAMQERIERALVAVPGERGQRLHRDASASYVAMRTAAAADGVTLAIGNSHRGAASAGNRPAVAALSSHILGLAVDLNMSHFGLRFAERSTRPFQNVVDMYKSPVHKWMFLRGATQGWFPYRREPWHWEYNPVGFRERLRQPDEAPTTPPREAEDASEGIADPVPPPRPPLAISGSVGRGGQNAAANVVAVQDRLVELRAVDAADIAGERPSGTAAAPEASLPKTIDAIERFQRQQGIPVNGTVAVSDVTRAELDRVIPLPTPAELTAIDAERGKIGQTINRGLTVTGPVGATASGNAIEDVRVVQRRLVDLGMLAASHRESPAQGATGNVPQSALAATIAALRRFQQDVRFFLSKRTITGAIAPGVVAPGDATATLLDRISVYNMSVGSTRVSFKDHVASGATQSETGVMFVGTASPSALPLRTFTDLGLTPGQAAALKLVSTFEGNFDAINTYDRAIVSAGFIQFAGGRGLPPYIALLKVRQPAKFRDLLQKFGVDVEFGVTKGAITGSRIVVADPAATRLLRASAAEASIRDDKRLTTALILSGRDRDVQNVQIESAIRGYVLPASNARIAPTARGGSVRLGEILRSQKGMAALYDRAIQEGVGAAVRRFERIVQRLVRNAEPRPPAPPPPPPTKEQLQSREGDVMAELERDLQAATDVGAHLARARELLGLVIRAAGAAGATVAALLAQAELANARRAVTSARIALPDVVNLTTGNNVDTQLKTMNATLTAEEARLSQTPSSVSDLRTALETSRQALASVAGPLTTAPGFLRRIQRIRRSTLDSGLAEVA